MNGEIGNKYHDTLVNKIETVIVSERLAYI